MHKKGKFAESKGTGPQEKEHRKRKGTSKAKTYENRTETRRTRAEFLPRNKRSVLIDLEADRYSGRGLNRGTYTVTKDAEADRSRLHTDQMEVHND